MKRFVLALLAVLALVSASVAQEPPVRVASSVESSETLAQAWLAVSKAHAFPSQDTYCLYGSMDAHQGTPVMLIETAVLATGPCEEVSSETRPGEKLLGIVGLLDGEAYQMEVVNAKLGALLRVRTDLHLLGEVHAITRIFADGDWHFAPLVWAAVRGG